VGSDPATDDIARPSSIRDSSRQRFHGGLEGIPGSIDQELVDSPYRFHNCHGDSERRIGEVGGVKHVRQPASMIQYRSHTWEHGLRIASEESGCQLQWDERGVGFDVFHSNRPAHPRTPIDGEGVRD
jgi:hypothetical protein